MNRQKRTEGDKTSQSSQAAFARNVRWACDRLGFGSLREAAETLDVGYDWLRRAVTKGVAWTRGDNPALRNLATFFDVRQEVLWDEMGEVFRKAVLVKADPDYLADCLALEAVLRHYGNHRPDLLRRCLDVIAHYNQKIANPTMESPEDRYCFVEADATESLSRRSYKDWIDKAVEDRLSRARKLPKRKILEEAVQARIEQLQRQEKLGDFHSQIYWEHGDTKREIIQMIRQILLDANEDYDRAGVDDEAMARLAAMAEGYVKKLWEGEYQPGKEPATKKSGPNKK